MAGSPQQINQYCEQSLIFLWKVTTRKTLSRERLYNNIVVCNCAGCQDQELDGFKEKRRTASSLLH